MEREEREDSSRLSYSNIVAGAGSNSLAASSGGGGRAPGLPQTPYAGSLQRTRNTLPKTRQRQGPPSQEVITARQPQATTTTYRTRTYSNSNRRAPAPGPGDRDDFGSRNTLPRVARRDTRPPRGGGGSGGGGVGGGQYSSYGTLPRNYRQQRGGGGGGRPQSYGGGSGSLLRSSGRGRQQEGLPPRAPSQRVIYRSRRQPRPTSEVGRSVENVRARSLPRQEPAAETAYADRCGGGGLTAAKSMVSIWLPDGKCPSFADILKRSSYAGSADLADKGNSKYLAGVKICHILQMKLTVLRS
jgi:hypothetical protein